jgi:hypothetical protein
MEGVDLTRGIAIEAWTMFHWKPRNGESVDGVRLDFSQWIMKPALIRREGLPWCSRDRWCKSNPESGCRRCRKRS